MDLCTHFYKRIIYYKQKREKKKLDILLKNANKDNTPWFSFQGQELEAKVVDIYDGDTMTIAIPFNRKVYKKKCRLINLDTAEIRTKNEKEKSVGMEAKNFVKERVLNKRVFIKCGKEDKYGRLLIQLFLYSQPQCYSVKGFYKETTSRKDLSSMIIDAGLGYRYEGKTKERFEEWYNKAQSNLYMISVDKESTMSKDFSLDKFSIDRDTVGRDTYVHWKMEDNDLPEIDEIVSLDPGLNAVCPPFE